MTPPDTQILAKPPAIDSLTEAIFEFAGTDNRVGEMTFECSLDATGFSGCSNLEQFSDLTRGTHTLRVRAVDVAGLVDPSPAMYTWTVAPPPLGIILSGPDEMTEARNHTFTFTSDVTGARFWCWLDGVLEENCNSPKSYTNVPDGEHMFAVLAWDPTGTVPPTSGRSGSGRRAASRRPSRPSPRGRTSRASTRRARRSCSSTTCRTT